MNKYWFRKRMGPLTKDLGWGWIPVSIEGYIMVALLMGAVFAVGYYLNIQTADTITGFKFLGAILALIILFALIAKHKTNK